jgi:hypothetical protein
MKLNKKPIIAEFKGKDGSLGFIKGQVYVLKVVVDGNTIWVHSKNNNKNALRCPYDSVQNFLNNWKIFDSKYLWNDWGASNPKKDGEYLCLVKKDYKKKHQYMILTFTKQDKWEVSQHCEHILWTNLIPSPF